METAEKNLDLSLLLEFYGGLLSPRQREMAEYHYNDDLSLSEIAELCAITRQGVWDGLKKAEAILRDAEDRLHLYENYRKRQTEVDYLMIRLKAMEDAGQPVGDLIASLERLPL